MLNLCKRQLLIFAVFEPFLCGLVTADVELPYAVGHLVEVLGFVDPDLVVLQFGFVDAVVAFAQ